jgi:hypothetical protein
MRRHFFRIGFLALGILLIWLVSPIFMDHDTSSDAGFAVKPLSQGFSLDELGVERTSYREVLAGYPDPMKFLTFEVPGPLKNISTTCQDTYLTILVYPREIDYRTDLSAAVVNQAYACASGELRNITLDAEIYGLAQGEYYIIVADQGASGAWHNPRGI